jgi:hemerythrin-like domain-containing protein
LLRQHIQKEERRLFPLANTVLTSADQEVLLNQFDQVEDQDVDPGQHERYLDLANNLAKRFGVQQVPGAGTCCCHAH